MNPQDIDWMKVKPWKFNLLEKYEEFQDDSKKFMTTTPLRLNGSSVKMTLQGEVVTDGINVSHYGQSFGLLLSDDKDADPLKEQSKVFKKIFPDFNEEWEVKDLLRSSTLFLKLKSKDGQYRFKSNIKMDPEQPKKCNLHRKDEVEVTVEVQAYFNFQEQYAGFFLDVLEIKTKSTPAIKRRKKED